LRILFLDVDGVLNGHDWHEGAQSNTLRHGCIDQLSRVLAETGCRIVLSSAWRYLIHGRAMTTRGFEALLRSHGACGVVNKIVGATCRDEECSHCGHRHTKRKPAAPNADGYYVCRRCDRPSSRADQVSRWLREHGEVVCLGRYVVLDDSDYGFAAAGHPFVQTDGAYGLTAADADQVIALLTS
jgi:hypothetical protein